MARSSSMTTLTASDEDVEGSSSNTSDVIKNRDKRSKNFLERTREVVDYDESFIKTKLVDDTNTMLQDGQRLTPPMSPKRKLLDQRIRGATQRKRLFQDLEGEDESKLKNLSQDIFRDDQTREIDARNTQANITAKNRNPSEVDGGNPGKLFKKVDTEVGKCMFAFFTQTNEVWS